MSIISIPRNFAVNRKGEIIVGAFQQSCVEQNTCSLDLPGFNKGGSFQQWCEAWMRYLALQTQQITTGDPTGSGPRGRVSASLSGTTGSDIQYVATPNTTTDVVIAFPRLAVSRVADGDVHWATNITHKQTAFIGGATESRTVTLELSPSTRYLYFLTARTSDNTFSMGKLTAGAGPAWVANSSTFNHASAPSANTAIDVQHIMVPGQYFPMTSLSPEITEVLGHLYAYHNERWESIDSIATPPVRKSVYQK